jgi:hypothetical protein
MGSLRFTDIQPRPTEVLDLTTFRVSPGAAWLRHPTPPH